MFTLVGQIVVLAILVWIAAKYMPTSWKTWIKSKFKKAE